MTPEAWFTVVLGVLGLLSASWFGTKQIRSTTAADQRAAAAELAKQIAEARNDERRSCADRIAERDTRIAELTADRNSERARADALQMLINTRGLGSGE